MCVCVCVCVCVCTTGHPKSAGADVNNSPSHTSHNVQFGSSPDSPNRYVPTQNTHTYNKITTMHTYIYAQHTHTHNMAIETNGRASTAPGGGRC